MFIKEGVASEIVKPSKDDTVSLSVKPCEMMQFLYSSCPQNKAWDPITLNIVEEARHVSLSSPVVIMWSLNLLSSAKNVWPKNLSGPVRKARPLSLSLIYCILVFGMSNVSPGPSSLVSLSRSVKVRQHQ